MIMCWLLSTITLLLMKRACVVFSEEVLLVRQQGNYSTEGLRRHNAASTTSSINSMTQPGTPRIKCSYAHGKIVGDRTKELECCAEVIANYEYGWASFNKPLSRYLETLNAWECPQLEEECTRRLFAFNPFTNLLYDYFCQYNKFAHNCFQKINSKVSVAPETLTTSQPIDSNNSLNWTVQQWQETIAGINASKLSMTELLEPCFQVAQYELEEIHNGDFQEVMSVEIPFCEVSWCGFGGNVLNEYEISLWTCMSSSCRSKVIAIMIICAILGLAISVVNTIVIAAIVINPHLHNSQSTYKISLAAADLLVGVVILPTCISNLAKLVFTRYVQEEFYNIRGYEEIGGELSDNLTSFKMRKSSGKFTSMYSSGYLNFVGFFTAVSLFVSIYTLAGAGFDRLTAVYKPLSYHKEKANRVAKWACVISWSLAFIFGIVPTFVPSLNYGLILGIFITNMDTEGVYLYTVAFIIPLIIVWIVNVASYVATRKHSKFRKKITNTSQTKSQSLENRLARTLGLMVGVFTLNTLPLIILMIASLLIPNIVFSKPKQLNLKVTLDYGTVEFVAVMLVFSNSFWNFFIYSIRNRDFRLAIGAMYKKALRKIGISMGLDPTASRSQRKVGAGYRRRSSTPNLSAFTTTRKKSSVATFFTRFTSEAPCANNIEMTTNALGASLPDITADPKAAPRARKRTQSLDASCHLDLNINSLGLETSFSNGGLEKQESSSHVEDDSIFQSYVVDANASRLFTSVMENVPSP